MACDGRKLVDFNSAYAKRHGHTPRPLQRQALETQIETIIKSGGRTSGKVLAELDLESEPGYDIVKNIRRGDTIIARAGRGVFQLTFTHIDDFGMLVAMAFSNGRYEFEHHIAEGGEEKVWGGMLMDFRGFQVVAERLPLHQDGNGVLACVRITAVTDASLGPFSFEGL
ncbi:MAG: hypothetical protein V1861_04745 [Candidatus Micrarchaeota archaeon]